MVSLEQLKERKLVQWAVAYLAGAWGLLQVLDLLADAFHWSEGVLQIATVVLGIGLFAALVVAWYHGEKGEQRVTGMEIAMLAGILVVAGVALGWLRMSLDAGPAEQTSVGVASAAMADAAEAEQGSIAVLPFENMSADEENRHFSDGITEELLNVLAQLPELRVPSRTSAFAFQGRNVGLDSIARALNVRHVLEGSVRRSGDRVRITAQLIDAETGYHLWSKSYDRELKDIFAVQDEISREIVDQLQIELSGRAGPLAQVETRDPEAHTLLLKARQISQQNTREALAQAGALLEEAIARDPGYAAAHAALSRLHEAQAYYGYTPREGGVARARAEAERALALDSTAAEAHYVLGVIASDHDWDWKAAERHFTRAIEHNPGFSRAYQLQGWLLMRLGRPEEALAAARRAIELDPVSPSAYNNTASTYTFAGRPEKALELYEQGLQLAPSHPVILSNVAQLFSHRGRHSEAIRTAEQAVEAAPEYAGARSALGFAHARAGQREKAEQELHALRGMAGASPYTLATVHAGLGNRERVLDLLERAVEEHDPLVTDLALDPTFQQYRDHPRVRRLLTRMGLS